MPSYDSALFTVTDLTSGRTFGQGESRIIPYMSENLGIKVSNTDRTLQKDPRFYQLIHEVRKQVDTLMSTPDSSLNPATLGIIADMIKTKYGKSSLKEVLKRDWAEEGEVTAKVQGAVPLKKLLGW